MLYIKTHISVSKNFPGTNSQVSFSLNPLPQCQFIPYFCHLYTKKANTRFKRCSPYCKAIFSLLLTVYYHFVSISHRSIVYDYTNPSLSQLISCNIVTVHFYSHSCFLVPIELNFFVYDHFLSAV